GKLKADKTMRIVEYTIDGRNEEIKGIRLTDQDKQPDDFSGISNLVQSTTRSSGYVNRHKEYWKESPNINSYYNKVMTDGMDLMATSIRSKSNRVKFNQTEAGMYIIDAINEDKQIYLGGGFLAFTSDRWMTSKVGLDYEGIVASEIYGRLILGQKLIITSEFGDLIIGNIENSPSKAFGIQIKEGDFERIFIGTELDGQGVRKAMFRLVGKDGSLNLSEDGILLPFYHPAWDNLSVGYPLTTIFPVDASVSKIKEVKLKIRLENYRGFTRAVGGGGNTVTSGGSNNTTSSSEGWHRHMMFKSVFNSGLVDTGTWGVPYTFANQSGGIINSPIVMPVGDGVVFTGDMYTYGSSGSHSHTNVHEHNVNTYHDHPIVNSIFLGEKASSCTLKVNGQIVMQNINQDIEVDITAYVGLNRDNVVEISSGTNGRISLGVYSKLFIRF
ncbi:MAG: hypothetical protein ACRDD7_10965, partial [Peptostreptococcaceae bacterium]